MEGGQHIQRARVLLGVAKHADQEVGGPGLGVGTNASGDRVFVADQDRLVYAPQTLAVQERPVARQVRLSKQALATARACSMAASLLGERLR
jgi:hypothetical protein